MERSTTVQGVKPNKLALLLEKLGQKAKLCPLLRLGAMAHAQGDTL